MADQKITQLTALTQRLSTYILPIVEDPTGTPVTKKVTVDNLLIKPATIVVGPAGSGGADYYTDGTDDDVQINQAITDAAGGYVLLKKGTYSISASIELTDNTRLIGSGMNVTILRLKNSGNTNILRSPAAASGNVFFVGVANLCLDGNKANNSSGRGIYMKFAHTWILENVFIKDTAEHGVDVVATSTGNIALNNWFKNCRIQDSASGQYNLVLGAFAPNNHILNCIFGSSTSQHAVGLLNDETTFIGCHISGAGANGIYIAGSNNIIANNYIEASATDGIYVSDGVSGNRIEGNVAFNSGFGGAAGVYAGIRVAGQKTAIIGNRMFDRQGTKTQDYGIVLESTASRTVLRGNTMDVGDHNIGDILIDSASIDNDLFELDGWQLITDTWTYASATTFTVAGDQTARFKPGTAIRLKQTTMKYFVVVSSSYSAPNTTVTVFAGNDYSVANAAISATAISYGASPQGFPDWFAFTPTINGSGGSVGTYAQDSVNARVYVRGRNVRMKIYVRITNKGSWSGDVQVAYPIAASSNESDTTSMPLYITAQGSNPITAARGMAQSKTTAIFNFKDSVGSSALQWSGVSNNDTIFGEGFYEI